MDPDTGMQSLLRRAIMTLLLLVVLVLTAQGSSLPPNVQPRLERKDMNVLSIECRVPYHTAWMEQWEIPFAELQIFYQGRYLNDKPEVVANLTSRNTKPATYGRFRDADMFTATSVQLPETVEGCQSCRTISVLMALSGPEYYGYYSCEAKSTGQNSRAIYTALVDEQFVAKSLTQVNGTLAVKSISADEVNITWNDRLMQSSGSGEVSVERTVVDKTGQPLDNATILFRIAKDIPLPYDRQGTLLFTKSGPDSTGQSEVRLVVQKNTLSYPLWRYSCQVSNRNCHRDSKSHTATPKDVTCNCGENSLVIGLSVGLVIVFFLLFFCMVICYVLFCKLRKRQRHTHDMEMLGRSVKEDGTDSSSTTADGLSRNQTNSSTTTDGLSRNQTNSSTTTDGLSPNQTNSSTTTGGLSPNQTNSSTTTDGLSPNQTNSSTTTEGLSPNKTNSSTTTDGLSPNQTNPSTTTDGLSRNQTNSSTTTDGLSPNQTNSSTTTDGLSPNQTNSSTTTGGLSPNQTNSSGNTEKRGITAMHPDETYSGTSNSEEGNDDKDVRNNKMTNLSFREQDQTRQYDDNDDSNNERTPFL